MDPSPAQLRLVEHLRAAGIDDNRVLQAIADTPRARFVPPDLRRFAEDDDALPIGHGQTISQPFVVARMTAALDLAPDASVLEVGTGSGYQAAVLARLARRVVTVERIPELADRARRTLAALGIRNVELHTGDGTLGRPSESPFDAVIVTAAGESVPAPLLAQLVDGGRLVAPVGPPEAQELVRLRVHGAQVERDCLGGVRFVPLIGGGTARTGGAPG